MSKYPEWSEEDEAKLRQVYSVTEKEKLLVVFPTRNYRGIRLHAHKLGLYKANVIQAKGDLSPAELAYIAGFFDGEGHIGFILAHSQGVVKPVLGCTNTNPEPMHWIQERIGGIIYDHKKSRADYEHITFRLRISGRENISSVLTMLLPYLIVKKDAALKVLEWLQGRRYYESQSDRDLQYYVELRKINARRWDYNHKRFTRDEAAIESSVPEGVLHGTRGLSDNDRGSETLD